MNVLASLSVIAMSLFLLLGIFLLSEGLQRKNAFGWLGLFFILLGINSLDATLAFNGFYLQHPMLILWEDPMVLLYGPLIYFFTRSLLGKVTWHFLLHLIPFVLGELVVLLFHLQSDRASRLEVVALSSSMQLDVPTLLVFMSVFLQFFGYVWVARRNLKIFDRQQREYYANQEVSWSKAFINLITIIFAGSALGSVLRLSSPEIVSAAPLLFTIVFSILLTLTVIVRAMKYPIFKPFATNIKRASPDLQHLVHLAPKIEEVMKDQKLYNNPQLTIKDVAAVLGETERSVSNIINHSMAENFYDYVNGHRIEAAKQILAENEDPKLTVLEVMYQVGFNSKSSFNTQFKKKTGLTPSSYRNQFIKK